MKKLLTIMIIVTVSMTFALGQDCEISGLWVAFANFWIEGGETEYEYPGVFEGQEVDYEEREYWYFTEDGLVATKWVSITDNEEDEWNWGHYEIDNDSITISGIGEGNKLGFTLQEVSDFPEGAEYQHSGCMLSLEEPSEDEWTRNFLSTDTEGLKSDIDDMETPGLSSTGLWLGFTNTWVEEGTLGWEWPGVFAGQEASFGEPPWREVLYFTDNYVAFTNWNLEEVPDSLSWTWGSYSTVGDTAIVGLEEAGIPYGDPVSYSLRSVSGFPADTVEYAYSGGVLSIGSDYTWHFLQPGAADSLQGDIDSLITGPPTIPDSLETSTDQANVVIPANFSLSQNYPNPFNPVTTIDYNLPKQSQVKITVYNMLGEQVEELVNEVKPAGYNTVQWNASGFSSGLYFYRIKAGSFTDVKKCILVK